jgi:hypothetical protein
VQQRDFLIERQTRKQVLDAFLHRLAGVEVEWRRFRGAHGYGSDEKPEDCQNTL